MSDADGSAADGALAELFARLPDDERRALLAIATHQHHRRGDLVYLEGDRGDALYVILSGKVAVRVTTPEGDVATLTVLGPGDPFGEVALVSPDGVRTAAIHVLEPLETLVVRRRDFEDLRQRQPSVERFLVDVLSRQVKRLTAQVRDALYVPVDRRLARRLCELADIYAPTALSPATVAVEIVVPLTQEDLASMVGTTRPTCNAVLNDLVAGGMVRVERGRTVIVDLAGLRRIAG